MPNLLSARSRGYGGGRASGDDSGSDNRACYGIVASAVSLLLFCVLAASVNVWMAFAFGGFALVAFAVAGCLAPASWRLGPAGGVSAEREDAAAAAGAQRAQRRFGMPGAAINALPTFPYVLKGAEGGGGGDLESGHGEACSVCLEDIRAGKMVRQLPVCKHLFHVECIDMWLHSHRTCPVCRCNLSLPPRKVPGKAVEAPGPETEAPADDALPPA